MRRVTIAAIAALLAGAPLAAARAETPPRAFTLVAVGDVMVHESIAWVADQHAPGRNTHDFSPMFASIEPWISGADLAICQMEMTLSPTNTGLSYYPRFIVPHELADAVAGAGFDACSTASNHSVDGGVAGLEDTIALLEAAGVATTGTARSAEERLPNLYVVNGVTVGHLAYTWGLNGLRAPEPWMVNVIDADAILADARWAREQGAEFVIVSIHWGEEYQARPTFHQTTLAETLTASPDVDLILGHHVHVVQPIARVNGKVVVYGMSNFISNIRGTPEGRTGAEDGIVVHLEVAEQGDGAFAVDRVEYTPFWIDPATKEVLPIGQSLLTGRGHPATLQQSWQRTVGRVDMLGGSGAVPTADPWPEVSCRGKAATILGTTGDDSLTGTDGDDVIVARGGNDSIRGGGGHDLICGGAGNDIAWGEDGSDLLLGGPGNDLLIGDTGNDILWGEEGDDVLVGGEGADLLIGGPDDDFLRGGAGGDIFSGGDGADRTEPDR